MLAWLGGKASGQGRGHEPIEDSWESEPFPVERLSRAEQARVSAWLELAEEWRHESAPEARAAQALAVVERFEALDRPERALAEAKVDAVPWGFPVDLEQEVWRLIDKPSRARAQAACDAHARLMEAKQGPIPPSVLSRSARAVAELSWWEQAHGWGLRISAAAGLQDEAGVFQVDDEQAFEWAESASMICGRLLLSSADQEGLDARGQAAWRLCASWPWPIAPVCPESVEWARRKWREAPFGCSSEDVDRALSSTPPEPTWIDLTLAKMRSQYGLDGGGGGARGRDFGWMLSVLEAAGARREIQAQARRAGPGDRGAGKARL